MQMAPARRPIIVSPSDAGLSTDEMAQRTGTSYRQLHYWQSRGVFGDPVIAGSGGRLRWSPDSVEVIRILSAITSQMRGDTDKGGVATSTLRQIVDAWRDGGIGVDLGDGVWLVWNQGPSR